MPERVPAVAAATCRCAGGCAACMVRAFFINALELGIDIGALDV